MNQDNTNLKNFKSVSAILGLFVLGSLFAILSGILYFNTQGSDILDRTSSSSSKSVISANNEYFIRQENVQNDINANVVITYALSESLVNKCKSGGCYVRSEISKTEGGIETSGGPSIILNSSVGASGEITILKTALINMFGTEDIEQTEFNVKLFVDVFDDKNSDIGVVEGVSEKYVYEV